MNKKYIASASALSNGTENRVTEEFLPGLGEKRPRENEEAAVTEEGGKKVKAGSETTETTNSPASQGPLSTATAPLSTGKQTEEESHTSLMLTNESDIDGGI